ncbi:MAG: murein hydrolase activator EnvC [Granulosicoccus sp.]
MSVLTMIVVGCSYVPTIENRLQALQIQGDSYISRAGETLESIAFRYNMSVAALSSLNPSLSSRFPAGTYVNVRGSASTLAQHQNAESWIEPSQPHAIRRGDVVITQPVYRPEAVASVNAVARDINRSSGSRASQQASYPVEEIIEDDYEEVERAASRERVDKQLRKYIGAWAWPTDGQLARSYAPEKPGGHGVDIAGLPGQHVVAAMDGTVAYSGRDPSGFGKLIIVKHDDSLMTTYSHTQDLFVAEDDVVRAGDPIASLGSNANQESVLRFEVRRDGNPLNPMDFFPVN